MPKTLKPKKYQKAALLFGLRRRRCAWYIDPGMGKTAIALLLILLLKKKQKARRFLVVAEINIADIVWPAELKKWKQFKKLTYTFLHGPKKDKKLKLKRDIYLINPEGLKWLLTQNVQFDGLIIDESSKFKNPSSQRFKLLKKHLPKFNYRIIMSGTPAPNCLQDLFSQNFIVDLGRAFGEFITHFRHRYFYLIRKKTWTYKLKPGSKKAIEKKLRPRSYVLRNTKIKKPIFNYIRVSMDSEMLAIYKSMEKKLFAEIEGKKVFAASAGSAYQKCSQIANGALYEDPDSDEFYELHSAKLDALADLVSELQGKPLLVGYHYRHDIARLRALFPGVPHIGGGVSKGDRRRILKAWNKNKLPVLFGQLGSISHGLNLQGSECRDVCYFALTDNLDAYEQFYRRVYGRHGSKTYIRVHHIVTRQTVDLAKLTRIRYKGDQQLSLLKALQEYRNSRQRAF